LLVERQAEVQLHVQLQVGLVVEFDLQLAAVTVADFVFLLF
jgi:hypothetical protein